MEAAGGARARRPGWQHAIEGKDVLPSRPPCLSQAAMPNPPARTPDASPAAVDVRGLVKHYGKVEALRGVDIRVGQGEMFALLGPNGAGKTTLFSILATLRAPTSGQARVLGRDVVAERDAIRREMGIVFQEPAIEQRLSGRDNLFLMGLLYGLPIAAARRRAAEVLEQLGISDLSDRRAQQMSGGQRRKLELARALVTDPPRLADGGTGCRPQTWSTGRSPLPSSSEQTPHVAGRCAARLCPHC